VRQSSAMAAVSTNLGGRARGRSSIRYGCGRKGPRSFGKLRPRGGAKEPLVPYQWRRGQGRAQTALGVPYQKHHVPNRGRRVVVYPRLFRRVCFRRRRPVTPTRADDDRRGRFGQRPRECHGGGCKRRDHAQPLLSATHPDTVVAAPVLGDLIAASGTPAWARLAGNTTATRKFLRQTGAGAGSALPAWRTRFWSATSWRTRTPNQTSRIW
jgi:hypothetical protein